MFLPSLATATERTHAAPAQNVGFAPADASSPTASIRIRSAASVVEVAPKALTSCLARACFSFVMTASSAASRSPGLEKSAVYMGGAVEGQSPAKEGSLARAQWGFAFSHLLHILSHATCRNKRQRHRQHRQPPRIHILRCLWGGGEPERSYAVRARVRWHNVWCSVGVYKGMEGQGGLNGASMC